VVSTHHQHVVFIGLVPYNVTRVIEIVHALEIGDIAIAIWKQDRDID